MDIDLKGRVAIVTGAGRGIGREIARTLAREGVLVTVLDSRQDLLDGVTKEWAENGWRGAQLLGDVRLVADCKRAASETISRFGRIDILVNNAGVASGAKVEELSEDVWDANFDINL